MTLTQTAADGLLLDRLLYRDGLVLVIDKPAGLPVHAGPKGGPTVESYLDALRFGLPQPPHLAHRLDRDTSGCLVLGRHRKALRRLGKLFAAGLVRKTYWAVTEGVPEPSQGVIDRPLTKRSTARRGWWMQVDEAGQKAVTRYRVRAVRDGRAWLELEPLTGRTHQLRVHLAAIGCPIAGDPVYGSSTREPGAPSLLLHARGIVLPLYEKKAPIDVRAAPPPALQSALDRLTGG